MKKEVSFTMINCTCYCYFFYGEKLYFVVTDQSKGNQKVPVVMVDENSGNSEEMLISEIRGLGLMTSLDRLVPFEKDVEKKTATFFVKTVIVGDGPKGMSLSSVGDLFNNICREQFRSFVKLLSIMKKSGEFLKTEIDFFQKMEELRLSK